MLCVAQFSELTKAIRVVHYHRLSVRQAELGFPLVTSTPADELLASRLVLLLAATPGGVQHHQHLTPRRRASTTAWISIGSEKTNIFTRSDFEAPRWREKGSGRIVGRTISDREDTSSSYSALERVSVRDRPHPRLDEVQASIDAAGGQQFVVGALLRDTDHPSKTMILSHRGWCSAVSQW